MQARGQESPAEYSWVDTPIGRIHVAATHRGLCRVAVGVDEQQFLAKLSQMGLTPRRSRSGLVNARRELVEYVGGRRREFTLVADLTGISPFQRAVLDATTTIEFGRSLTYGELARQIGRPRASRAVGNALGANPIAVVIPCHRVVGAGGRLGGYAFGAAIKRALMRLEAGQDVT